MWSCSSFPPPPKKKRCEVVVVRRGEGGRRTTPTLARVFYMWSCSCFPPPPKKTLWSCSCSAGGGGAANYAYLGSSVLEAFWPSSIFFSPRIHSYMFQFIRISSFLKFFLPQFSRISSNSFVYLPSSIFVSPNSFVYLLLHSHARALVALPPSPLLLVGLSRGVGHPFSKDPPWIYHQ